MAEGEINIDNLIQRLLEGQFWFEYQKLVKSYLFLVSTALVKKNLPIMQLCSMTELYARRIKWILYFHEKSIEIDLFIFYSSLKNILVRGSRPGKTVQMTENEVRGLCLKSREIFLQQPILLELEAPLKICGKFDFLSLLEIWREKLNCGCTAWPFFILFTEWKNQKTWEIQNFSPNNTQM